MQICLLEFAVRALHLWRRLNRVCIPPACTSLTTARNCSEWLVFLSLPSSHHLPLVKPACTGGGIVLECRRKSRGLSSAPSETAGAAQALLTLGLCHSRHLCLQCAVESLPQTHTHRLLKPAPRSGNMATSCGFGVSFVLYFSSCCSHKVFKIPFGFTTCTDASCETKSPHSPLCHQNAERFKVPPTAPLESHLDTAKTPLPEMTYLWKTLRIVLKSNLM